MVFEKFDDPGEDLDQTAFLPFIVSIPLRSFFLVK